jgi:hypothetical protein
VSAFITKVTSNKFFFSATSEGGYGGNVNSTQSQRGLTDPSLDDERLGKGERSQGTGVKQTASGGEELSSGGLGEEGALQAETGQKSSGAECFCMEIDTSPDFVPRRPWLWRS